MPPLLHTLRLLQGKAPARPNLLRLGDPGAETFIGYYEVQPVSADGAAVLAHRAPFGRRAALAGDEVELGWYPADGGSFRKVAQTGLWCWQMGARLRWWPGEARALTFNGMAHGEARALVTREGGAVEAIADVPLFDIARDWKTGFALNFGRLAWTRPGYGYPALADPFADEGLPAGDGVRVVDMASGTSRLVYAMPQFAALLPEDDRGGYHYLNALAASPAGSRFSVLYKRIPAPDQPHKWTVEAVVGRSDGSGLVRVPLPGRASHYWWLDEDRVLYTANRGMNSRYVVFDCRDGSLKPLGPATPGIDGHPSFNAASGRWITDQYPDFYGEQALYLLDGAANSCREVARMKADQRYQDEWRCDLHPRWSPDGGRVLVDSTHEGFRAIYLLDLAGQ